MRKKLCKRMKMKEMDMMMITTNMINKRVMKMKRNMMKDMKKRMKPIMPI